MRYIIGFVFTLLISTSLAAEPASEGAKLNGQPEGGVQGPQAELAKANEGDTTDKELQQFAVAYSKVARIRKSVGPELKSLETKAEKDALKKEAGRDMKKAIKSTGLSVEQFNSIVQELDQDPQLRKRLRKLIQDQQK
ncbi:MAG TPA: hypothetical protein DEA96_02900 [Leptospiraceae bacterium]|nr:hypothetical protein [Spirochaetaceae bacterium]HBS03886.1 hypothetical protein [Leptospiraceae bacterium]|tara:strand:+ start:56807 stop:57220 length:414 start_codon:yes stop_codon:yes gene_type:complete